MIALRIILVVSTAGIYLLTAVALASYGPNWPAVAAGDLSELSWRTQFDFDLIVHLVLLAAWIGWREKFTAKGIVFAVLSIAMGGMFSFPYLIYASYVANGDVAKLLLGKQGDEAAPAAI